MTKDETQEKSSNLVQLLCAMQKSLLIWCYTNCSSKTAEAQSDANYIVLECRCFVVMSFGLGGGGERSGRRNFFFHGAQLTSF